MPVAREFGRKKTTPQPLPRTAKRSSLPLVAAAVGVFAIGGLAVLGWHYLPAPDFLLRIFDRSNTARLGRAATAPILNLCISPALFGIRHEVNMSPGALLQLLEMAETNKTVAKFGKPPEHSWLETAQKWGEVADCVYRQNSYQFCDIDNRALAVEAANIFVRLADRIAAQPQSKYAAEPGEIPALTTVRDRVIDSLKARLRNGALIKEDFEGGIPVGIARVLVDAAPPVHNECAKQ
jgi:hypothetical protein